MPMMVMTVPVTTGGKKRISRLKYGAIEEGEQAGDDTAP